MSSSNVLKTIKMLGLDNRFPIDVKGVKVAPRDVVAACLPDPAHLGDQMFGKTCAGTWVKGTKDGKPRQVYLYQVADNETCMRDYGVQAVVWQTAVNPVIGWELLDSGVWSGSGVLGRKHSIPTPSWRR
jgi:saccharopine dehydrogenase-like NADP-dependent oxidoreductase